MGLFGYKLDEGFIFYHVLEFLKSQDWRVIGGEPPDGTSDDVPRIVIRDSQRSEKSKNKNTQKIDLMAIKLGQLLLIELKPLFDITDKKKLDNLVDNKITDIFNAIEERTEIKRKDVSKCIKSLGFSNSSEFPDLQDFVLFLVNANGEVHIKKGTNISKFEI